MIPPRTYRCAGCRRWFVSRLDFPSCPMCGSREVCETKDVAKQPPRTPAERAQLAAGTHIVVIQHGVERVVALRAPIDEADVADAKVRNPTVRMALGSRTSITVAEAKKLGIV